MNKSTIFFLLILLFNILISCYDAKEVVLGGEPIVYKLTDTNTFFSDTLILYGENLTSRGDTNHIVINDTLVILSAECVYWTASKISFIVPKLPAISNLYVVIENKKVLVYDNENSAYQTINVLPYPQFDYVEVPSGSFLMGDLDFNFLDESPVNQITLTESIFVSTTEITQRLYSLLMNDNPSDVQLDNYPVYNVTWLDAIRFCNELSSLDSLTPAYQILEPNNYVVFDVSADGWRLPTEAEWEYFSKIDFGSEEDMSDYSWYANNSGSAPKVGGLKKPNSFGLYDVLGNVWEWCWDYYQENFYSVTPFIDPTGPLTGTLRVFRGGSCDDGKLYVRSSFRGGCLIESYCPKVGIRLVRKNTFQSEE